VIFKSIDLLYHVDTEEVGKSLEPIYFLAIALSVILTIYACQGILKHIN